MLKKLIQGLSGSILLILAFCSCVFIGKEKKIAIVTLMILLLELGCSYFILEKKHKLKWVYTSAIVAEILFLALEEFFLLAFAILLLLVAAVWNIFSVKAESKGKKLCLGAYKVIFTIMAVLVSVFFLVDIFATPVTKSVKLSEAVKVTIDDNNLDSKAELLKKIETMNSFGSRTTGTKGHNEFISWLKQQVTNMGFEVHSDNYTFDRWEEKRSAVFVNNEEVQVSSAFPYSGETDENGVKGELVYTTLGNYDKAKGKIAVVEINNTNMLPIGLVMNERNAFPKENHIVAGDGDLVITSALQNPKLIKAKEMGVQAVILVWKGVSDAKVKDQYLPFTEEYMGIPAVWLNETEGKKVIEAAKKHEAGKVILEAEKQKNAPTESFYVTIEGRNKEEAIIVNSHTDGVNVVEEDGAVGMLSMLRYLKQEKPERTLVFAFVTGHFRLPVFKGTSQATSTWLQAHPGLWDGKKGHLKAVAGLTVEHLGSMEWKDNALGQYEPTGKIQTEYTYTSNEMMNAIWMQAIEDRKVTRTVTLRGHNKFEFGESQPLFEAGIPLIGLIPMPDYLTVNSESREMDKFNIDLAREQLKSLLKATIIIDNKSTKQLGKADGYSFFFGRTK